MTQANRAKINMAAIHRRMSGRHSRQQSINSLFMFHHIVAFASLDEQQYSLCLRADGASALCRFRLIPAFFLMKPFRKLVGTGDQRFVIGDAIGGCGGLRVASTL